MRNILYLTPRFIFFISFISINILASDQYKNRSYPIEPVPFYNTMILDSFWSQRIKNNQYLTIPHAFKKYEQNGIIRNFEIAAGSSKGDQGGNYPFDESDLYKTIEGASYVYRVSGNEELKSKLDTLVQLIAAAQEKDGYLYTARTNNASRFMKRMGPERWSNLKDSHELYNVGHLYEAAVAHFDATGAYTLLEVALRNAELIQNTFGPGKLELPPGHQEIELGLTKLWRLTGNTDYLNMATFFLEQRGYARNNRVIYGTYAQDHMPVLDQEEVVGHAVRAPYMFSVMTDIAAFTDSPYYNIALNRLWENLTYKKLYITGGIGSVGIGEGFSDNYDLPNMTAYNETCSSIALMMWNQRMFCLSGQSKFIDILERTLYNAFLAGVSMDGVHFFYDNPLASRGQHTRREWLYCACCISNLTRFFPQLPSYIYAQSDHVLYVNLYVASTTTTKIGDIKVDIVQKTNYPWDGKISIQVSPDQPQAFDIRLRIPGWARGEAVAGNLYHFTSTQSHGYQLYLNDEPVFKTLADGYVTIYREWNPGDQIELLLPMEIQRLAAHRNVTTNIGRMALQRGPLVYCIESIDQPERHVMNLLVPKESGLCTVFQDTLLSGMVVLDGRAISTEYNKKQRLVKRETDFRAIPYFAWAHRGKSEMTVWIAEEENAVHPLNSPSIASRSISSSSGGRSLHALSDHKYPDQSTDSILTVFVWSEHQDTAWVQYNFPEYEEVSETHVFWKQGQQIDVPESWRLLVWFNGQWHPVWSEEPEWGVATGIFNKKVFETVRTKAVRLEAVMEKGKTSGIFEWRIF